MLEGEVLLEMILVTSRLRHWSLIATSDRRTTLIGFKPLRIIELKEYNDEKAFKLVILKLKGYALIWYEILKKSLTRETKSKIKT